MTAPRQLLRGSTYLVTRRCSERRYFLTPRPETTETFGFVLAAAARHAGVRIHAACVLSNHYHLVVTDPHAQLPLFHQYLDALVARAVNALNGHREAFWSPATYSAVVLATPEDVVEKAAYALANPVAAGLVRSAKEWPGLWSSPDTIGGPAVDLARPEHFFDRQGALQGSERLELEVPPGFGSAQDFRVKLKRALARLERKARRKRRRFLGVEAVLRQRWDDRPEGQEPLRKLDPKVAGRDPEVRRDLIGRLKEFVAAYGEALRRRHRGEDGVIFPAGTYQLRVQHGVACAGSG